MPYPAGHRPEVKKKIINSARKLFNRYGFDNVSLKQIMSAAGLTHGGFYSYFGSKSDLYAEVVLPRQIRAHDLRPHVRRRQIHMHDGRGAIHAGSPHGRWVARFVHGDGSEIRRLGKAAKPNGQEWRPSHRLAPTTCSIGSSKDSLMP